MGWHELDPTGSTCHFEGIVSTGTASTFEQKRRASHEGMYARNSMHLEERLLLEWEMLGSQKSWLRLLREEVPSCNFFGVGGEDVHVGLGPRLVVSGECW